VFRQLPFFWEKLKEQSLRFAAFVNALGSVENVD
jgi:hypothetical protein